MTAVTKNRKGVNEILKILFSETPGPVGTKLCLDSPWMIPFQNCFRQSRFPTNMTTVAKNRKRGKKLKKITLKLLGQLGSKLCQDNPLVIPFQNFVWQFRPRTKMDAVTKN